MKLECSQCRRAAEGPSWRFLQGGQELRFCKNCWTAFPTLPGPLSVLSYQISLTGLPNVGAKLARRICERWRDGDARVAMLRENPYALTELNGFGFLKADKIAMHLGLSPDSPRRHEAATVFVLQEAANMEGHTWQPREAVEMRVRDLHLRAVFEQDAIIAEGDRVALKALHEAEHEIAERLAARCKAAEWTDEIEYGDLKDDQRAALEMMLRQQTFVLLGAAGTGKTTLIKTLLENISTLHGRTGESFALAAPTGKAARRMTEATGVAAKTIHRLLEAAYNPATGGFFFQRDEDFPLDEDWIILDECSMLDVRLMRSLLRAIPGSARLIMVGDPWQLPSVGAGDVLRDITTPREDGRGGTLPNVALTQIKRQDQTHLLAANCARVRQGQMIEIDNANAADCFFADVEGAAGIVAEVVSLVSKRIPEKWGVKPEQAQVLCALREKGEVSAAALNQALRAVLNPAAAGSDFAAGDRVIQTANNYELGAEGVMNGECGTVLEVKARGDLWVKFDNIEQAVFIGRWQQSLDFAWALTVHKSQGSEWSWVIIPIHKSNGQLVARRRWFYTALSRGKRGAIVIGDRAELGKVIGRVQDVHRFTHLGKFLCEAQAANSVAGGQSGAAASAVS